MVAKDRSRPFIVHTPQGDTRVYGTEFHISTHNETTKVTLVSGSIGVTPNGGKEQRLSPGQQIIISQHSSPITEVDLEPYIAWNMGRFAFREWTLERVMSVIGRWYGYRVEFASEKIAKKEFSGNFDRYDDIHSTLEAIERVTECKCRISNQTIYINQ